MRSNGNAYSDAENRIPKTAQPNQAANAETMNCSMFEQTLKVYFEAFAEKDRSRRLTLLSQCLTEDAEIWGPQKVFKGYESISG